MKASQEYATLHLPVVLHNCHLFCISENQGRHVRSESLKDFVKPLTVVLITSEGSSKISYTEMTMNISRNKIKKIL